MNDRARWYVYVPLIVWIVVSLAPAVWMLESSFKNNTDIYSNPPIWWVIPNLDAYFAAFRNTNLLGFMLNSLQTALVTTFISLFLGVPAAWGLSKFHYPLRKVWFYLVIGTRLLPPVALIMPFFSIFTILSIKDTAWALVIPYVFMNMPLAIWICKNYFDGIPTELVEAGMLDGAKKMQMFGKVGIPMILPGIVLSAILVFLFSWNEFMFALTLTSQNAVTLPVGVESFFADGLIIWNQLSAAVIISLLPAILFVAFFQRHIIKGVTDGAMKG